MATKHIICYSGGHSSALTAIEVVRKFGAEDVILLNHDINPNVEDADIKRFKREVSEYLGVPITYANHPDWETKDQFDMVLEQKAFKVGGNHNAFCTYKLKTMPFERYLDTNFKDKDCVIYYGFDANEKARIQRRSGILGGKGYRTDYPLALWAERTIKNTAEIGITPPNTYSIFKHANCVGCLKAGKQHWYAVYCLRPDIWERAKMAEDDIGYSIIKTDFLEDLEPYFARMKDAGVIPTEHINANTFFAQARRVVPIIVTDEDTKPCECVF